MFGTGYSILRVYIVRNAVRYNTGRIPNANAIYVDKPYHHSHRPSRPITPVTPRLSEDDDNNLSSSSGDLSEDLAIITLD